MVTPPGPWTNRALIFGRIHHLVNLYQYWSKYAPGAKNGLTPGFTFF